MSLFNRCIRFAAGLTSFALLSFTQTALSQKAFVRVNQIGYEANSSTPARAYLMSKVAETGATFTVMNEAGKAAYSGKVGSLVGTWSHSDTVTYQVYALDFSVPAKHTYTIAVTGPAAATSPKFAVDKASVLYPGLLVNTLFFYQTQRDGGDYIPNALRSAPGHLKDKQATVYQTPPVDDNDWITYEPPTPPLVSENLPPMDAEGGWWDAGDYMKYVETVSYTDALMEIGVRDFPNQMGAGAPKEPAAPPVAMSYAGTSGTGSPKSSDFTGEARFGTRWLLKMWDGQAQRLAYQVDNSQDWDYYGEGDPGSSAGYCGGTYSTPYCLITEYDIWTLPQVQDNYSQSGDPGPCDQYTTYYICNRPVFSNAGTKISPNLAGRLAASFATCYQIHAVDDSALANRCLKAAEQVFSLADLSYPDPGDYGVCATCLLTIMPYDGYPESVWDDDMELGATELYFALKQAKSDPNVSSDLLATAPLAYLKLATQFASNYVTKIYNAGGSDTLNLYDVSGLAHYELYKAIVQQGDPASLAMSAAQVKAQLLAQVNDAITVAKSDAFDFGYNWRNGDTTSHGAGLSVMASEAYALTGAQNYDKFSREWMGNIMGANSWGVSFIVGDGTTFPNCIQHQVANISGSLEGTSGGTPILWGAAVEGPTSSATSGLLDGMNVCPANGVNVYKKFNGNSGAFNKANKAVFKDDVQSYSTTEPGIDLTSTSFLMWSWRLASQ